MAPGQVMADSPRRPDWLKVALPGGGRYATVRRSLDRLGLHTVCEEARCPNAGECWGAGTATVMILGDRCTRGCRFCAVRPGARSGWPDPEEPGRVARLAEELGLAHLVVTSVTRDDLPDGGASQFVAVAEAMHERLPAVTLEVLTPDFQGEREALARVARCGARVLGHNLETVRRLTPSVRHAHSSYDQSLSVLAAYRRLVPDPSILVKSSLLLGLGETWEEVREALSDLLAVGVQWVTLGQYLRPARSCLPVQRYVPPDEFSALEAEARAMGFSRVVAGPLVRSSFRAAETLTPRPGSETRE